MKLKYLLLLVVFFQSLQLFSQNLNLDSLKWMPEMALDYPESIKDLIKEIGDEEISPEVLLGRYQLILKGLTTVDSKGILHFSNEMLKLAIIEKNEEREVDAMYFKGLAYTEMTDYETAFLLFTKALEKAKKIPYLFGKAQGNSLLAGLAQRQGKYAEGVPLGKEAVEIFKNIEAGYGVATASMNLGNCYYGLGEFELAIKHLIAALRIYDRGANRNLRMQVAYNIAACYVALGNYKKAKEYASKCLELTDKDVDILMEAGAENVLGAIALREEQFEEAVKWFRKSVDAYEKTESLAELATAYSNLGSAYLGLNDPESCLKWNEKALEIGEPRKALAILIPAYSSLGSAYAQLKNWDKSIYYQEECLKMCEAIGNQDYIRQILHELASTFLQKGDYEKAYEYSERYHLKEQKVFTLAKEKQIEDIQTKYETAKKDKLIIEGKLNLQKEEREKNRYFVLAFIFISISVIVMLLLRNTRKQKRLVEKQNQIVENEKLLVEKSNQIFEQRNQELAEDVNSLEEQMRTPEYFLKKNIILTNREKTIIPLKDIIYLKAEGNGLQIITENQKIWEWRHLKDMKTSLPKEVFLQTHRSFIANIFYIRGKKAQSLTMSNGDVVKIGNTIKDDVHRFLDAQALNLGEN